MNNQIESYSYKILSSLLSSMNDVCIIIDNEFNILTTSNSFFDVFKLSGKLIEGESFLDFLTVADGNLFKTKLEDVFHENANLHIPVSGIRRDGTILPFIAIICGVNKSENRIYSIILVDKSEQMEKQQKIEQLEQQAAIGTFTSIVSHEFNNILTGIRGYAQLAQSDLGDDKLIRKAFNIIENETTRGSDLCKNISLYSGNKRLNIESVNIANTILKTIEIQNDCLKGKKISIKTDFSEIPPVMADRTKIEMLLLNLLNNARHAILPKGKGSILIKLFSDEQDCIIQIIDDGVGIENQNLTRIFDPFYSNKTNSDNYDTVNGNITGTGLGLPVCHIIVKQHGGTISVDSQPDMGTTFTIKLPKKYLELKYSQNIISEDKLNEKRHVIKALIVDDEMSVREIIFKTLESMHIDSILAKNANDILQIIEDNKIDIIFLDYILPDMNADRILPIIKSKAPLARVVIISGWSGSPQKKASIEKKVDAWIEKPFNVEAIIEQVRLIK